MREIAFVLALAGLSGCRLTLGGERPVLTVEEVVAMHRAGVPSEVIVAKVSVSRMPRPLTVIEMVRLKDMGVDDRLLSRLAAAPATDGGEVYYHAPYGPYPEWDDPDDGDPRAPTAHPYWGDPRWVHRQRLESR